MKNSTEIKDGETFQKEYLAKIKEISTEDLLDILTILYSEPEFALYNADFDKLEKAEKENYLRNRAKMETFEQEKLIKLRLKLNKDFGVFKEEAIRNPILDESPDEIKGVLDKTVSIFPKASLLTALIKATLNLRETGKEYSEAETIKSIDCFTSDYSEKDYFIVINDDYLRPIKVSKNIKIWNMFFELIENRHLEKNDETQDLYDYLNFNPNNRLSTNTGLPIQKIIEQSDSAYKPKFKTSVQTEKALVQRQNKLKSST